MKSIQSIRRGERLTILILVIFFIGMGILVFKVVRESSFYMSHSDDVTLGKVYDRNNQVLFDPDASTENYDANYFLDVLFFLLPYGVTAEYQPFKFFNRN